MQDSQAKRAILTWLFPNIFGHPLLHNIWVKNELIYQFNYNEAVSNYIGVITVLFAAVGIFYKDRLPYSRFFIGLSLFAAIISYRVPVIGPLLSKIPPISLIHPKRMIIITSFALIVLAAQRMNMVVSMEIRKKDVREKRKYISILWAIGICFSLISLNLYQCSLTFIDKGFHSISQLPLQEYGPTVIAALTAGEYMVGRIVIRPHGGIIYPLESPGQSIPDSYRANSGLTIFWMELQSRRSRKVSFPK